MNAWTSEMLGQDIHAGDPVQARMIRMENDLRAPIDCAKCGGSAHYKHTVGTHICTKCHAVKYGPKTWGW
ncbi:hypothetical protein PP301_gp087 [Gordonia phage GMA2]|uniref:Uncharacterized protein n=1 Tax=Gordonia phage GMA2 TaxID=1647283 RepID=A0A0K0N726_9CAUD|nr:hypothetical protein PP301_gp087 [Gordonia phage GMA2]AKJ72635.1 hypothetical protein GMA2_97 [Gordonia phage GMA2]